MEDSAAVMGPFMSIVYTATKKSLLMMLTCWFSGYLFLQ